MLSLLFIIIIIKNSLLIPAYKLIRKNTLIESICDIVFKKAKDRGGTVNRKSVYDEAAVRRVL